LPSPGALRTQASTVIRNCTFSNNGANSTSRARGGAVHMETSRWNRIRNSKFTANTVITSTTNASIIGGSAIYSARDLALGSSVFTRNVATYRGPPPQTVKGAVYVVGFSNIVGSLFRDNSAGGPMVGLLARPILMTPL
jgi:hypothetical protein